jgi:thioredoxin 1
MSYAKYSALGTNPERQTVSRNTDCLHVESMEHKRELLQSNRICVFDIYGDWCGPCKIISPKYVELAQKYNNPPIVLLAKENVDMDLSPKVNGVPCFYFYKDRNFVHEIVGGNLSEVEAVIEKLIQQLR